MDMGIRDKTTHPGTIKYSPAGQGTQQFMKQAGLRSVLEGFGSLTSGGGQKASSGAGELVGLRQFSTGYGVEMVSTGAEQLGKKLAWFTSLKISTHSEKAVSHVDRQTNFTPS
ncbi:hypothetical protein HK102_006599 [Quaeritorhiza haematococci]|nr:hypothetical protein HK102_006599 [Quaeritorhiza haematococci]